MGDAQLFFFRNADGFFFYCDKEKYQNKKFISKIDLIISDFDLGNDTNIINSKFFSSLEKEEEKFNGKFVLCTGFNESIMDTISDEIKRKIDFFFQKRPTNYKEIRNKINFVTTSPGQPGAIS